MLFVHILEEIKKSESFQHFSQVLFDQSKKKLRWCYCTCFYFVNSRSQGAHEGRSLTAAHLHVSFTTTATEVTELQTEATPKAWRQANSNTQESTHTAELGCLWFYIQASQILGMTKLLMGITWLHFAVLLSVSPGSVWRIQASSASHLQKRRGLLARLLPGHFCTRNSKWIKHQSLKQVRLVGVIVLEGYDDALL